MPFRKRKDDPNAAYRVPPLQRLQLVDGYTSAPTRDPYSILMDEIEKALQHKRQVRSCLARLLCKKGGGS